MEYIFLKLLEGVEVRYNTFLDISELQGLGKKIIWTPGIDELMGYCYGLLEYRCLKHEHLRIPLEDGQGCSVMNYPDLQVPWTRVVEHRWFNPGHETVSWITKEYPSDTGIKAYPIETQENRELWERYRKIIPEEVILSGRMAEYRYYNMNQIIEKIYHGIPN